MENPNTFTVTIGSHGEGNLFTVFNASVDVALGWVNYWYAEATGGRFHRLEIVENGDLPNNNSEPSRLPETEGPVTLTSWRSIGVGWARTHEECISTAYGLICLWLRKSNTEDTLRVTRIVAEQTPVHHAGRPGTWKKVGVKTDTPEIVKLLCREVIALDDPFRDDNRDNHSVLRSAVLLARRILGGI